MQTFKPIFSILTINFFKLKYTADAQLKTFKNELIFNSFFDERLVTKCLIFFIFLIVAIGFA